jgi:hypothetical protein
VVTSLFMGIELTTSLEPDEARADSLFRTVGLMASLLEGLLAGAQPVEDAGRKRGKRG